MEFSYQFFLAIGGILLAGQAISTLGKRTFLPRVTLLLLFGVGVGQSGLDIIPGFFSQHFEIVAEITLLMVGFLIGGKLTLPAFQSGVKAVVCISISAALVTAVIVSAGLTAVGLPADIAIILGCIASATAPAATLDVVMENNDKSPFSQKLISIVTLDDAWALMLFALGVAIATSINGHASQYSTLLLAAWEIMGAILLGLLLGYPAAYLTGRIKPGEPILTEALGLVFICGGLAIWLDVSFLISSIVMGAVVANVAKHHDYPFHEIENIEWPFMVIFFVLAGATLEMEFLLDIGLLGIVYIFSRIVGKIVGTRLGAKIGGAEQNIKNWMGIALLPQAGVAIGMALVATHHFPEYRQLLLSLIISSTIVFEVIGPIFTRLAIRQANR